MRVIMTGGGTGGHVNPALAIADIIKTRHLDAEIIFVGAKGRIETQLVPKAGYELKTIAVRGFQRQITLGNIARNFAAVVRVFTSTAECKKILKDFKPDVVIGTGGYVSGPLLRQAAKFKIPTLVHESNAYPGLTVKMLAKYVDIIMVSSEEAREHILKRAAIKEGLEIINTGNPLLPTFKAADKKKSRELLGFDYRPVILSYGGSLGASKINDIMTGILIKSKQEGNLQHIHATGALGFDKAKALLEIAEVYDSEGFDIRKYIDNMPQCMAAADIVICRAGAMTLSELMATGKPSVLIPSPYVTDNHQYHNAMLLVKKGAAVCVEEKDLTVDLLWEKICDLTLNSEKLAAMGQNAKDMEPKDVNEKIYEAIFKVVKKK